MSKYLTGLAMALLIATPAFGQGFTDDDYARCRAAGLDPEGVGCINMLWSERMEGATTLLIKTTGERDEATTLVRDMAPVYKEATDKDAARAAVPAPAAGPLVALATPPPRPLQPWELLFQDKPDWIVFYDAEGNVSNTISWKVCQDRGECIRGYNYSTYWVEPAACGRKVVRSASGIHSPRVVYAPGSAISALEPERPFWFFVGQSQEYTPVYNALARYGGPWEQVGTYQVHRTPSRANEHKLMPFHFN